MTTDTSFLIGAEVRSADGVLLGRLDRVIVDPIARTLTHLVIEPGHRRGAGRVPGPARLVPAGQAVATANPGVIRLLCSAYRFLFMEEAVDESVIAGTEETYDYHRDHVSTWPFYGVGGSLGIDRPMGLRAPDATGPDHPEHGYYVAHDKVPVGEVGIRRGEPVHAADGPIGHVAGLVVDPVDHQVTHVLTDEGHLWGHKQVAIPIDAVSAVDGGIQVKLTRDDVRELPPVAVGGS